MKILLTILLLCCASSLFAQKVYCCVIAGTTVSGSGGGTSSYTVEKVVRLNFSNPYESAAQQPGSPKWNMLGVTDATLQTAGGYSNSSLLDETGAAATGWSVSNLTAFQGTTGSAPPPATANSGLYPDAIVTYGWTLPATGDMTVRLSGLNPAKSYQVHLLANDESWKNSLVKIYSGAIQSSQVNANSNYGSSADNEYAAAYVCHLKNVHPNSSGVLDISINSSNGNNPNIVAMVIQQTNIDNPN